MGLHYLWGIETNIVDKFFIWYLDYITYEGLRRDKYIFPLRYSLSNQGLHYLWGIETLTPTIARPVAIPDYITYEGLRLSSKLNKLLFISTSDYITYEGLRHKVTVIFTFSKTFEAKGLHYLWGIGTSSISFFKNYN